MYQKTTVENAGLLIVWKWKVRCGLQIATIDPLPLSGALGKERCLTDVWNRGKLQTKAFCTNNCSGLCSFLRHLSTDVPGRDSVLETLSNRSNPARQGDRIKLDFVSDHSKEFIL
jgi:hypothetical protein